MFWRFIESFCFLVQVHFPAGGVCPKMGTSPGIIVSPRWVFGKNLKGVNNYAARGKDCSYEGVCDP